MTTNTEAINRMFHNALGDVLAHNPELAGMFAVKSPSYRYFGHDQVRYCWNTSPVDEPDGRWFAWEYRPVGAGARTGHARRWEMKHRVRCGTRAAAKAKALGWYRKAKAASRG